MVKRSADDICCEPLLDRLALAQASQKSASSSRNSLYTIRERGCDPSSSSIIIIIYWPLGPVAEIQQELYKTIREVLRTLRWTDLIAVSWLHASRAHCHKAPCCRSGFVHLVLPNNPDHPRRRSTRVPRTTCLSQRIISIGAALHAFEAIASQ